MPAASNGNGFNRSGPKSREASPLAVLIVDDHAIARAALRDRLESGGIRVCGEATNANEARSAAERFDEAIILLDAVLGQQSGLDLLPELALNERARSVIVLGDDERLYAEQAIASGALGYLAKERADLDVVRAVNEVAAGRLYSIGEGAARGEREGVGMTESSERYRPSIGDVVEVVGHRVGDKARLGEVIELLGDPGREHFRVRWEDGHVSVFYPGSDAIIRPAHSRKS
jgi:CheY-like chemotaxis protein